MRYMFLLISLFLLSACGGLGIKKTEVEVHVDKVEVPELDCRPYPKPDVLILGDVEPQSREDGWFISHEDYKKLSDMWDMMIQYMTHTRSIARYFVECIEQYNELIDSYNQESGSQESGIRN